MFRSCIPPTGYSIVAWNKGCGWHPCTTTCLSTFRRCNIPICCQTNYATFFRSITFYNFKQSLRNTFLISSFRFHIIKHLGQKMIKQSNMKQIIIRISRNWWHWMICSYDGEYENMHFCMMLPSIVSYNKLWFPESLTIRSNLVKM